MSKGMTLEQLQKRDRALKIKKGRNPKKSKGMTLEQLKERDKTLQPESEGSIGQDALMIAKMIGEAADRYTGAPTRSAIEAVIEAPRGKKLSSAGEAFMNQMGEPTQMAPTGTDIAKDLGFKGTYQYPVTNIMGRGGDIPQMQEANVADLPGLAIDVFADWTLLSKLPVKTAQMIVRSSPALRKKMLTEGGEKVLNTFMDDVSVGQVNKLMQGPSGNQEFFDRTVGSLLLNEDLAKYSGKPKMLLDKIAGKEVAEETLKGLKSRRQGGLLGKKKALVDSIVKQLRKRRNVEGAKGSSPVLKENFLKGTQVATGETLLENTMKNILDRSHQLGKAMDAEDLAYVDSVLRKELKDYFEAGQREMFGGDVNPFLSFEDLHRLKQELGETLRENAFKANPIEATVKRDTVLLDLYHQMKNELEDAALRLDPNLGEQYIRANADMSAMMTLKKALGSERAKQFKKAGKGGAGMDALLSILGGAGGLASAQLFGFNPITSTMVGMGVGGSSRRLMERAGNMAREFGGRNVGRLQTGNVLQGPGEQMIYGAGKTLQSGAAMSEEPMFQENTRAPQSIPSINPIVEDKLIERNSEWVMQHPNLVQAKLLKSAPELAVQVGMALEKGDMRTIQKIMPQVAQQVPEAFEQDDYGIFDGKIIDPNARSMYIEKVMEDPNLDSLERAEIIDHLNRTNEVMQ
jgi:hypothetical protein